MGRREPMDAHVMNAERSRGPHPSGHIELPLNLDEAERWGALGLVGLGLFARATAAAARNLTDGFVSQRALERLTAHLRRLAAARLMQRLVDLGFWGAVEGGWQFVSWPSYALPAAQVRAFRASQAEKALAGGRARAATAQRDAAGHWTSQAPQPDAQPAGLADDQPGPSPVIPNTDVHTVVSATVSPTDEENRSLYTNVPSGDDIGTKENDFFSTGGMLSPLGSPGIEGLKSFRL